MFKIILTVTLAASLSACATIGDSAAIAFSKETGCPAEQVRYEALLDGANLYQVTGCGKNAHYSCHNEDEEPSLEPKTDMAGTPANPIVCTKLPQ